MSSTEIRELYLYIVNTEPQYRQAQMIMDNLAKKVVKGTYDGTLALKAWQNLADRAASQYDREYGSDGGSMKWISKSDRTEVAKQLQEHFQEELDEKVEAFGGKKASLSIKASIDVLSGKSATADLDEDERAKALLDYLKEQGEVDEDLTVEDVDINRYGQNEEYTVEGSTYLVLTSDEAEKAAGDDIENSFDEMGLEAFTEGFQYEIENYMTDTEKAESLMEQDIRDYVDSMDDNEVLDRCSDVDLLPRESELEEKLEEYIQGDMTSEEAVQMAIETEWIAEDDEEGEDYSVDELKNDSLLVEVGSMDYEDLAKYCKKFGLIDEGDIVEDPREALIDRLIDQNSSDPVGYFKEFFAGEDFSKFLIDNNLIDINKVIEACISADGVAHFIARYDGEELDLGNDLYAYRVD